MSNPNLRPTDIATIVATIEADLRTATVQDTSHWVSMGEYEKVMGVIQTGGYTSTVLVDLKFEQATDDSGTGAKDITGKAITQLAGTGGADNNKVRVIELDSDELDVANGFDYVRLVLDVTGTGSCDCSAVVLGFQSRYQPPSVPAAVSALVDEIIA